MENLTESELKERLQILKEILKDFDINKIYNVSFINIDAFYSYLDKYNNTPYSIKKIILSIDKYIPLKSLADYELMDILENGLNCDTIEELNYFRTIFYKKALIRFLYLIKKANTKEKWAEILTACENIRKMG